MSFPLISVSISVADFLDWLLEVDIPETDYYVFFSSFDPPLTNLPFASSVPGDSLSIPPFFYFSWTPWIFDTPPFCVPTQSTCTALPICILDLLVFFPHSFAVRIPANARLIFTVRCEQWRLY